jgi:hypothetical protein
MKGPPRFNARRPDGAGIEVDCLVPNKDIGFVGESLDVEVKLEAFPFARYGLILGRVRKLGRDAATNPNAAPPGSLAAMAQMPQPGTPGVPPAELAYSAKVTLLQDWILVDGRHEKVHDGMRVSAEIKTGDRRVIDFACDAGGEGSGEGEMRGDGWPIVVSAGVELKESCRMLCPELHIGGTQGHDSLTPFTNGQN